jgi:[ribosomal protein S5]-alanine N-acetyltransferase
MIPERVRLQDGPTAIRPTHLRDLDEQTALRRANRSHTEPWEPLRDETFYETAGQRLELELDQRAWSAGTGFAFSVLDATAGDRLVGRVALANVVRGPWQNATLGYWVAGDVARRGHATRAVSLVLDFAFGPAGLHRVQPAIIPRNLASVGVARRVGFRLEGRATAYLRIAGRWEDHDIYALTAEEWARMRAGGPYP